MVFYYILCVIIDDLARNSKLLFGRLGFLETAVAEAGNRVVADLAHQ